MNESLAEIKRELERALGPEDYEKYLKLIRKWFAQDLTKEQFDFHARKLVPFDKIHYHNQFFVAILSKCNIHYGPLSSPAVGSSNASGATSTKRKGFNALKEIIKRSAASQSGEKRFRPSEPIQSLPIPKEIFGLQDSTLLPENLHVCTKDGLLPDRSTMFGRALVITWESGLDEIDEASVDLLVLATRDLLKNVMQTAVQLRRNFVLSGDNLQHLFGIDSYFGRSKIKDRPRDETGELSKAAEASRSKPVGPMCLRDLYDGLKVRPNVLSCQTVYSVVLERILCKLETKTKDIKTGD